MYGYDFVATEYTNPGVGNSFGLVGHIRDNLDIRGPIHVHLSLLNDKADIFLMFNVFS
jgi:hypothetical protein